MNVNHAIRPLIEKQDTKAAIVIGRSIANRALAIAMFTQMGIIRQRNLKDEVEKESEALVGLHALVRRDNNRLLNADRTPPIGIAPRKTLEERLADCALQYEFGDSICREFGESEYDLPQDVPSRVTWQISQLRLQADTPVPKPASGTSLAAIALANQPRYRAKQDLDFLEENAPEIVVAVDAALYGIPKDDAIEYVDALTGFDRYQLVITGVEGLARKLERMMGQSAKLRPGSHLAKIVASDIEVMQGAWRDLRSLAVTLEKEDAAALLEVIESGRSFRDVGESDARLTALGLNVEAACEK